MTDEYYTVKLPTEFKFEQTEEPELKDNNLRHIELSKSSRRSQPKAAHTVPVLSEVLSVYSCISVALK